MAFFTPDSFGLLPLRTVEGLSLIHILHRLWSVRPAEIFNLPLNRFEPGDPADFFLFDPEEKWTVSRETLYSKSYNTPFLGREMQGRVRHHWLGGVQLF